MRYVGGVDKNGNNIDVKDPLAVRFRSALDSKSTTMRKVTSIMNIR